MKEEWLKNKAAYILFFVLTLLFYGNTLTNKYSLDDEYITVTNFPIKGQVYVPNHNFVKDGFKGIPKIWVSRYAHDGESAFDYRPIVTTTFAIEYGIFGQNPFISHLINIILYFILICVLFNVLFELFKNNKNQLFLAFATALLFLIHPIHTEVAANLKCRDELLASLFALLAVKHLFNFIEKPSFKTGLYIISFLFIGLLSKLSAVLIMISIPLMILFYRKIGIKKTVAIVIGLIATYKLFQLFADVTPTEELIRIYYGFENPMYTQQFSFFEKIIVGIKTYGFYIESLIFPYPLRFYYGSNMFDFKSIINADFIATIVFIIACAVYYWKKRDKDFLFAFLFLGLTMFPFLNIMTPVAGILGDRLVFIPSIGFCLLLSVVLKPYYQNFQFNKLAQIFSKPLLYFIPIIIITMIYSFNRNKNWNNKLSLFEHDIVHLKKSAKANSLLGNEYFVMLQSPTKKYPEQVLLQKALSHYSTAVTNDSTFFSAYNNAGVIYYSYLHDLPKAKQHFKLAIRFKPIYPQAYENLGNCYKAENNIKEAFECYKKAILINPKFYSSYIAGINLFFENKDYKKALAFVGFAETQFPNNYEITALKANCFLMMGNLPKAVNYYQEAYLISPNSNLAKYISSQALKVGDTATYKKYSNI